jgi:site-specific DNA recombinase
LKLKLLKKSTQMKTAVIMSRVSSDEQALGYSLGIQEEALTKYCEKNNIRILYKFKEDHSAKDFNRPEFSNFLVFAKKHKGEIDYLLVTSWDRFSRNITDAFNMIRTLKNLGIIVQAIEQHTDLSVPENLLMLAMFLAIPEVDNERRSIKIRGGMQAALKAGRWCRKAPKGYVNARDKDNKPIIIPGPEAVYIQRIFQEISKGREQVEIRSELKKEGYIISKSCISELLRNPIYIGKIRIPANHDESERIVDGIHEGIISEDLFYYVQEHLNVNLVKRNIPKYSTRRPELLLRGNLKCSLCGNKLTGSPSRGKGGVRYFYYHCNHCGKERYRADKANGVVSKIMSDLQTTSGAKEVYNEMVKILLFGSDEERNKKITVLEKDIKKQDERINRLQDLLIDGSLSGEDYTQMKQKCTSEKASVERRLNEIRAVKSNLNQSLEKGVGVLADIARLYAKADLVGKKQILGSIFPEDLIFDGKKCRTPRINEVLRFILLIDSDKHKTKCGQISEFLDLSAQVELRGVEPRSSQGDHMLSTCLVLLDFRDQSAAEQPNRPLFPVCFAIRPEKSSG